MNEIFGKRDKLFCMADYKYGEITEKIIGASFRVHGTLGNGFQEVIYQRALELELKVMGLEYAREFEMPIYYMDQQIGTRRVDFLIEGKISVELGSKRMEFHRFTNKKHNPTIILHPIQSNKFQ